MRSIDSFLDKFKRLLKYTKEEKRVIIRVIREAVGVEIDEPDIKIRNKVIYIKTTPQAKSEIFIRKQKLLEQINIILNKNLKDVR